MSTFKTASDLGTFVYQKLLVSKVKGEKPSENILKELFNVLFYASLSTEESDFVKVTVTLLSKEFRKSPSANSTYDEARFFPFIEPIVLTEKSLIKLSKAADPWSSSLAIDYNENNELYIYGMIDQALHFQSFLNYEREEKPNAPGIIQVMVEDVGVLNVIFDFEPIATLNKNELTRSYIDVFKYGPIASFVRNNTSHLKRFTEDLIKNGKYKEFKIADWEDTIETLYIQSICRILLKIKNYHHGGAIVITNDFINDFVLKYKLTYDRLQVAQENFLSSSILFDSVTMDLDRAEKSKKQFVPMEDYIDYAESVDEILEIDEELKGAVRFISSLSCVDGLVVLSYQLNVQNFGTVIEQKFPPDEVWVSTTARIGESIKAMDPKHLGTRHRSMFAYCNGNPDALGFVISQDGEIRAVMKVGEKVVVWEHIKVHQYLKSKKILPFPPAKS